MKTKKRVVVNLYGMDGYGATKADAKADAALKLTNATMGRYEPKMLRFPTGIVGLVYRDLYGWQYSILHEDRDEADCSNLVSCATRNEAERKLRFHVAQNLIFEVDDNGLSVILDSADRLHHNEYVAWQKQYKEYKSQGYSDTGAYRMACESRAFCPPAA